MRYKVKSEFLKLSLFLVACGIGTWCVLQAGGVLFPHSAPTKKESVKEPEVIIERNIEYYSEILDQIINDCKCGCEDKKFNEDKFQRLVKKKIPTNYTVRLWRKLIKDSTGSYYKWKAELDKDTNTIEITWR